MVLALLLSSPLRIAFAVVVLVVVCCSLVLILEIFLPVSPRLLAGCGGGLAVGCSIADLVSKLEPIPELYISVELAVTRFSMRGAHFQLSLILGFNRFTLFRVRDSAMLLLYFVHFSSFVEAYGLSLTILELRIPSWERECQTGNCVPNPL